MRRWWNSVHFIQKLISHQRAKLKEKKAPPLQNKYLKLINQITRMNDQSQPRILSLRKVWVLKTMLAKKLFLADHHNLFRIKKITLKKLQRKKRICEKRSRKWLKWKNPSPLQSTKQGNLTKKQLPLTKGYIN